jgi:hypothetical protein
MTFSLRRSAYVSFVASLALLSASPAYAQVGGPPAGPATIWQFLGIPQGIKKLQGATRNRRGNHPNLEPKPPMRAIADPRNLESPDPSIKKAAEVKTAEDLKAQKIKAVKYLASIGCGCYDADGGITAALVASMNDCTEDVRYETINAVAEAAEDGACTKCGQGCCCTKDVLTTLAKLAYERADNGCYLEPSERVRQAAADALVSCCPNDSPPVIEPAEPPKTTPIRESSEEPIAPGVPRETGDAAPTPLPPTRLPTPPVPPVPPEPSAQQGSASGILARVTAPDRKQFIVPTTAVAGHQDYGFGVILHASPEHGLAHVHFKESNLKVEVGSEVGVYEQVGQERKLLAKLKVAEAYPGSANVTGSAEALARISRGDVVLRRGGSATTAPSIDGQNATWVASYDEPQRAAAPPAAAATPKVAASQKVATPPRRKAISAALMKPSMARRQSATQSLR